MRRSGLQGNDAATPWLGKEVPGKISRGEEAYALLEAAYKVATHADAI